MMMLAVMYGMMPEREDRERLEGAAREQVEQAERAALGAFLELIDRQRVDAGNTDRGTDPVQARRS